MRVSSGLYDSKSQVAFNDRLNVPMTFKAKDGHCDVSQHGEDASGLLQFK
jgi:hypothetical protein